MGGQLLVKTSLLQPTQEDFRANAAVTIPIERDGYLLGIILGMDGDIVVAAGGADGTATGKENPEALVKRIEVVVDKLGTIQDLDARGWQLWRQFDHARRFSGADISGAIATYTLALAYEIPFALPSLARPVDSALNTERFRNSKLVIHCGDKSEILSGNDRTWTHNQQFTADMDRDHSLRPASPDTDTFLLRQFMIEKQVNGATANFQMELPGHSVRGEGLRYKEILFVAEADEVLVDTIINKIEIGVSGAKWFDMDEAGIKRAQKRRLPDAVAVETGLYLADLTRSGLISKAPVSGGGRDINVRLDVAAPGTINMVRAYCRALEKI